MTPAASQFIDATRWIAALLVVLIHAGNIFVNQADIMTAPHGPFAYVWWFVVAFGFGHQGLIMFFVFSGVLVGGPVVQRARRGDAFLGRYLVDRIIRIYIVLLPILAIGFCLDMSGRAIFADHGIYDVYFPNRYDPKLLLASLASLQGIWFTPFGTNEPLWSLGMECWYYIIFPLLTLPLALAYSAPARALACVAAVLIFLALAASNSYFAFGFIPWTFGALIRLAPRPLMRSKFLALALWVVVSVIIRLAIPGSQLDTFPTKAFADVVTSFLAGNVVLTLRFDQNGFKFCRWPIHKTMADFSFSLYALHLPALVFLWGLSDVALGRGWHKQLATPLHYAVAIGCAALIMVLAYGLSRVTEARTDVVRGWARRLLPTRDREARAPA